jgi:hypothetical protein
MSGEKNIFLGNYPISLYHLTRRVDSWFMGIHKYRLSVNYLDSYKYHLETLLFYRKRPK